MCMRCHFSKANYESTSTLFLLNPDEYCIVDEYRPKIEYVPLQDNFLVKFSINQFIFVVAQNKLFIRKVLSQR